MKFVIWRTSDDYHYSRDARESEKPYETAKLIELGNGYFRWVIDFETFKIFAAFLRSIKFDPAVCIGPYDGEHTETPLTENDPVFAIEIYDKWRE